MIAKPGFKTTEFWLSLAAQALGFAVLLGFITVNDSRAIEEAISKAVAAVVTVLGSAKVVIEYIKSRTTLKNNGNGHDPAGASTNGATTDAPAKAKEGPTSGFPRLALVALLGGAACLGPWASPASAQLLPWRQQIDQRLKFQEKLISELIAQRQTPAPPAQPPIIVLPIPGAPKQELPIGGEPKQPLPVPGDPRQPLPVPGEPKQPLPPKGSPKQDLPLAPPHGDPQRLTIWRRALGR